MPKPSFADSISAKIRRTTQLIGSLRRRIIDPSVKELQDKDGWMIEWRPTRTGRKATGLRFDFERNPQQQFELTPE